MRRFKKISSVGAYLHRRNTHFLIGKAKFFRFWGVKNLVAQNFCTWTPKRIFWIV